MFWPTMDVFTFQQCCNKSSHWLGLESTLLESQFLTWLDSIFHLNDLTLTRITCEITLTWLSLHLKIIILPLKYIAITIFFFFFFFYSSPLLASLCMLLFLPTLPPPPQLFPTPSPISHISSGAQQNDVYACIILPGIHRSARHMCLKSWHPL